MWPDKGGSGLTEDEVKLAASLCSSGGVPQGTCLKLHTKIAQIFKYRMSPQIPLKKG